MPLHVHRFGPGTGRPLIALHSLYGHGRRWHAFAADQLPGYAVHAPDLRGHGQSTTEPPWTLEQHADDIITVLDEAGLDTAPVIGHSLGATIAVHLARRAPGRVERLILLDPGIALPPELAEQRARTDLNPPVFDNPGQAASNRADSWPPEAHPLVAAEVDTHLVRGTDGRWRWRYSPPAAVTTWSELARPAVTPPPHIPTLLILARTGRPDRHTYADACRAALGDRFTLHELDSGHQIHLQRPDDTGRLTRAFLGN